MSHFSILVLLIAIHSCRSTSNPTVLYMDSLAIEDLGKSYERSPSSVPDYLYAAFSDKGGTTSLRRNNVATLKWKDKGYYQRNRELGQIFNIPEGKIVKLDAIVVRTGNTKNTILSGTPNAPMQIQLFEVIGIPTINNNETPPGTDALHGYTTNHRADDYLDHIEYCSMAIIRGGNFPNLPSTTQNGGEAGHLRYLRWDIQNEAELILEGGKRYAFMLGFAEDGEEYGFSLGNSNWAGKPENPILREDTNGAAWWSIRREGDGTSPPTYVVDANPPTDEKLNQQLLKESSFQPDYETKLPPTTNGFPDVDTYRLLEFYIEVKTIP